MGYICFSGAITIALAAVTDVHFSGTKTESIYISLSL